MNYGNIHRAQQHYENWGFTVLEVPWIVSREATEVTLPPGKEATRGGDGFLVGSAEQSFIEMMRSGELKPGRWQATTPCFRDEPVYDRWHRPWFVKLELIWLFSAEKHIQEAAEFVRNAAFWCFSDMVSDRKQLVIVSTGVGSWDIEYGGVELGSYGVRRFESFLWVYGTGLAEPRFSEAVKKG